MDKKNSKDITQNSLLCYCTKYFKNLTLIWGLSDNG